MKMTNYLDNLLLYSRRGLEELSKRPIQYTKEAVKDLVSDCLEFTLWFVGYYHFKKLPPEREIIQEPNMSNAPVKDPFIENIIEETRKEVFK